MHTMVDFITHVKGVEYILSLTFIAGFLLLWEALKPTPFRTVLSAGREDAEHLKSQGARGMINTAGKIAAAPFIGLFYVALLPVGFMLAAFSVCVSAGLKGVSKVLSYAGMNASFEWRPMEAYFTGKKRKKAGKGEGK